MNKFGSTKVGPYSDAFFIPNEIECFFGRKFSCFIDESSNFGIFVPRLSEGKNKSLFFHQEEHPTTSGNFITVVSPTTNLIPMSTDSDSIVSFNESNFPKTPVILIFSGLVICLLSVILFWVFKCRQQADEKPHGVLQNEYTPVPSESGQNNFTNLNGCLDVRNGKPVQTTTLNGDVVPPCVPPHREKTDYKEWYV